LKAKVSGAEVHRVVLVKLFAAGDAETRRIVPKIILFAFVIFFA